MVNYKNVQKTICQVGLPRFTTQLLCIFIIGACMCIMKSLNAKIINKTETRKSVNEMREEIVVSFFQ